MYNAHTTIIYVQVHVLVDYYNQLTLSHSPRPLSLPPGQQISSRPLSSKDGIGQLVPHAVPCGRGRVRGASTGLVLEVSLSLHGRCVVT